MARRGSLSAKMIVTTTLLVLVTVAGSAVLNVVNVRREIDQATEAKIAEFRKGREGNGEFGTPLLARATQKSLIDRGDDVGILETLRLTVAGDTETKDGRTDYGIRFGLVLDLHRNVVAHCIEDERLACVPELAPGELARTHPPIGPELGRLTVESWAAALERWREAARTDGPALVKLDMADADARYLVFAYPVVIDGPPSARIASAESAPERVGYVMLGYDLAPIEWYSQAAAVEKREASAHAALYSAAVGVLFVLIGSVLAIVQGLSITRPIKQLAWRADRIARGDLHTRVDVSSRDEIGLLGENFNFMADQISLLLEQTAEKARIEQELEVAKAIQETLVPGGELVSRGPLSFAGFYQPAAQTGGDWWTWHELVDDKVLIVIGDVTGHGVPSAIITAAAKAACDVARHVHGGDVTVTRLLEIMNHAIWQSAQRRFVMTCFASIVDTRQRTITYANAGHNFPYLVRAGADGKGELGSLMVRGNRLGDDPASRYEARTTELAPGDVVVWYTDGIVECEGPEGEEYGERRFRASVRRAAALPAGEMRDAIVADAAGHFGDMPRKDDITLIVGSIG
jgi:serine phosphatase RsbU (regulator of sigma subunit)